MVRHLPSPVQAQKYRVENLYEGPMDDECADAVRRCDPEGTLDLPLSCGQMSASFADLLGMRVDDVCRSSHGLHLQAGAVARSGKPILRLRPRVLGHGPDRPEGPHSRPGLHPRPEGAHLTFSPPWPLGSRFSGLTSASLVSCGVIQSDLYVKNIQKVCVAMGRYFENMDSVPAGNTVCLVGLDQFLIKSGTVTTSEVAHNFRMMKFSVSPVVRVAVQPKVCLPIFFLNIFYHGNSFFNGLHFLFILRMPPTCPSWRKACAS